MILVTGGTGLVGSHLLYQLSLKNNDIIAIFRSEEKLNTVKEVFSFYTSDIESYFLKIKWINADITNITDLEKIFISNNISYVYHCAGMISFNPDDYEKMTSVNINGTADIVNLCAEFNIKKLCFVSSIATLGDAINHEIITEENQWNNDGENSSYAITKNGAEMEVWRASQEGVDVVIVNPGVILGKGFSNGSSEMFNTIKKGFKFYTEGVTGFIGVNDVVKSMIGLMDSTIKNERFIIVSENKSFKDIFFLIADAFKVKKPSIKVNTIITSIVWRIEYVLSKLTGRSPKITKNSARASHCKNFYSSEKIKKTLNIDFETIDKVVFSLYKK